MTAESHTSQQEQAALLLPREPLVLLLQNAKPEPEKSVPLVRHPHLGKQHQRKQIFYRFRLGLSLCILLFFVKLPSVSAQNVVPQTVTQPTNSTNAISLPFKLNLGVESGGQGQDVDIGIKILFAITLLTLAPSIILLMTAFTRIVIVLSFVRTALSLQGTPANQIIIGLSMFITFFIMAPVWEKINHDAIEPYQAKQISGQAAMDAASGHLRAFMLRQTRAKDVELFVAMAKLGPTSLDKLPLKVVVPGFIISELRTAFQMGFLLFVPFILIDLIVATVLMSLGMMMMPPTTISLPLKILLFVLVDGWGLVVRSLVQSFGG
ncbi:MAG TPA: flagellar type III secretion system pore protein FliP [Verrucomicrobiae bacterium]|jgi:flagellar biosynthetic protein FliP